MVKKPCRLCKRAFPPDEMWWIMPPVIPRENRQPAWYECVGCRQ